LEFTVFSKNNCKYCTLVKLFITANGGKVVERNIDTDEEAYKDWQALGVMGVPVTVAGDKTLIGFTDGVKEELVHLLGING
jgi:glutaredoxin